jgi:hypothetical protein
MVVNYTNASDPKITVNATEAKTIHTGKYVTGLEVDQYRHYVFLGDRGNLSVSVIDCSNATGTIG